MGGRRSSSPEAPHITPDELSKGCSLLVGAGRAAVPPRPDLFQFTYYLRYSEMHPDLHTGAKQRHGTAVASPCRNGRPGGVGAFSSSHFVPPPLNTYLCIPHFCKMKMAQCAPFTAILIIFPRHELILENTDLITS